MFDSDSFIFVWRTRPYFLTGFAEGNAQSSTQVNQKSIICSKSSRCPNGDTRSNSLNGIGRRRDARQCIPNELRLPNCNHPRKQCLRSAPLPIVSLLLCCNCRSQYTLRRDVWKIRISSSPLPISIMAFHAFIGEVPGSILRSSFPNFWSASMENSLRHSQVLVHNWHLLSGDFQIGG